MISQMMFAMMLAATPAARPLTAPGPLAPLAGTLLDVGKGAPVVLIIPGSGPTDRDGNNPLGVTAAPYRLLAEGLAKRGISSVRIDKRGMFIARDRWSRWMRGNGAMTFAESFPYPAWAAGWAP
jgi:hypothetical protein